MTTLVAYASKHGSTESIAKRIAQRLRDGEDEVEVRSLDQVGSLDGYDRVVVGCPIYAGRWHRTGIRFLKRHEQSLRQHADRLWFFTVGGGPDIAPGTAAAIERYTSVEHAYLRGRLDRDQTRGSRTADAPSSEGPLRRLPRHRGHRCLRRPDRERRTLIPSALGLAERLIATVAALRCGCGSPGASRRSRLRRRRRGLRGG